MPESTRRAYSAQGAVRQRPPEFFYELNVMPRLLRAALSQITNREILIRVLSQQV